MKKYDWVKQAQEFIKDHLAKVLAVFFWMIALVIYSAVTRHYGISNIEMLRMIYHLISHPHRGFLILLALYCIRPLFFFPLGLLSGLCGAVFGLWFWFFIASIWENIGWMIGYWIGRFFGKKILEDDQIVEMKLFKTDFKMHTFLAVFLTRLSFLTDDMVNYGRWYLKVNFKFYFLGTVIGNLFFTFVNTLIGSSVSNIETLNFKEMEFDTHTIVFSVILYLLMMVIGFIVTKYHHVWAKKMEK